MITSPGARFTVPEELSAASPPESRGLSRDDVRLLVASAESTEHVRFRDIARFLVPGDLLVVNTSATLPAAVDGVASDVEGERRPVVVHFSTALDEATWLVELRSAPAGSAPLLDGVLGPVVELAGGGRLKLLEGHEGLARPQRVRRARVDVPDDSVEAFLARTGRPIRYGHVRDSWPLAAYQTVFAREPGSAEMPSAARPFTAPLVVELISGGTIFAPVVLHTGVSSLESDEPPLAERFRVPAVTARLVNLTKRAGGRVIAVGTTATRALESAVGADGSVRSREGWTDLVLGPERPARVVDGLVTGLHEPSSSHLLLLEAVAGSELVQRVYDAAVEQRYLWHEFGDACLLLPHARNVPE
ncbi:MAG TPA: S-adenosylmethionine:tRNA ribosyltransferase-isomerase [Candidatus Sulfotelmatobacter sp.]|nr:S-adenosylmethionine:tRNA ribosyltransferase-isomerase [Candidatus Sulfotelmatobacter sp.]